MTWTCSRMNACLRSLTWRGSKTPRNEFEQGGGSTTLRASKRNVLLARRAVAWRRRPPAVVGVAKSSSWSETSNPGKRHAMRRAKRRCERSEQASDETIYCDARARARAIYPAVGKRGQGPARGRPQHYATPMFAMRHGRSLAHYESGDPLGQAARVHRESPKRLSEQRSRGRRVVSDENISKRNTSDTSSGMRAMQSSKLEFEEQRKSRALQIKNCE